MLCRDKKKKAAAEKIGTPEEMNRARHGDDLLGVVVVRAYTASQLGCTVVGMGIRNTMRALVMLTTTMALVVTIVVGDLS